MLLCRSSRECDEAAADAVNEGLAGGQFCVYASVRNGDSRHMSEFSARIANYRQNVDRGDLLIVDFRPFYESALRGDLGLFAQLNDRIKETIQRRVAQGRGDRALIIADAAGTLSENRHFAESAQLEGWWHKMHSEWRESNENITLICPHPGAVLEEPGMKDRIAAAHSLTIDLKERLRKTTSMRALVVEPEADMQMIYRRHLQSLGFQAAFADGGRQCLEHVFNAADAEGGFDLIVIDTHLADINGVELARMIKERVPDQKIIFTTTSPLEEIIESVESIGIAAKNIIVKPFRFSSMLGLLRPKAA